MRKFIAGLLVGLLLATAGAGFAANDVIRLFVNGQEIVPDVSPRLIDGRVMVPARYVAEPLGAKVEWDAARNAVVITSSSSDSVLSETQNRDLIAARELAEKYGVSITILDTTKGGTVRLSIGSVTLETKNYKIIDSSMYFPKSILPELGL